MLPIPLSRRLSTLIVLLGFAGLPPAAHGQGAPPPPTAKPAASQSPNVRAGQIVAIDPAAATLSLKDRAGQETAYTLSEKTRYWKAKRAATATDFKTGEAVTLRLRKVRGKDAHFVFELLDNASWEWLSGLRRKLTQATIRQMEEKRLSVTLDPDALPMTYTVSDKTRWHRDGKPAVMQDFKAGDRIYILPRSLPGGNIMAQAVADTPQGAARAKERASRSVKGTIQAIDAATQQITLATVAGDTRLLACDSATEVRQSGKPLPWSALRAGQNVTARLRPGAAEEETAARITIQAARAGAKSAPTPSVGGKLKPGSARKAEK